MGFTSNLTRPIKRLLKAVKRHKETSIVVILCLAVLVILFIRWSGGSTKYGKSTGPNHSLTPRNPNAPQHNTPSRQKQLQAIRTAPQKQCKRLKAHTLPIITAKITSIDVANKKLSIDKTTARGGHNLPESLSWNKVPQVFSTKCKAVNISSLKVGNAVTLYRDKDDKLLVIQIATIIKT